MLFWDTFPVKLTVYYDFSSYISGLQRVNLLDVRFFACWAVPFYFFAFSQIVPHTVDYLAPVIVCFLCGCMALYTSHVFMLLYFDFLLFCWNFVFITHNVKHINPLRSVETNSFTHNLFYLDVWLDPLLKDKVLIVAK